MVDKDVMATIEARTRDRAQRVYDARGGTIVPAETIADCFEAFADDLRAEADEWERSKRKGWQSMMRERRNVAMWVASLAVDLRKLDVATPTPDLPKPGDAVLVGINGELHGGIVGDDGSVDFQPIDVPRIDGETDAEYAAAVDAMQEAETPTQPTDAFSDGSALAYLSGATDVLPAPTPGTVITIAGNSYEIQPETLTLSGSTLADEVKADQMTNPTVAPTAFIDPPDVKASVRLGPMWTFEDLMQGIPTERQAIEHWSWSQLTTLEDCGLKYRFQRIEQLPQVPQWANVGGSAFHACAELITLHPDAYTDLYTLWKDQFHAEISGVATTTTVPVSDWRAANKGSENYTWWLTQGPDMLQRYVDWRAERNQVELLVIDGRPVIEYETEIDIAGVKVKVVIDQAWRLGDGSIEIVDFKSGRSDGDSGQLGLYAHALNVAMFRDNSYLDSTTIYGTFFDARKGIATPRINLLERHPWNEYVYRVHTAEAQRRAGLYAPRRSAFCGGCSVRYACPVGGA